VPAGSGLSRITSLPGIELPVFEERWTGGTISENERQSFRTRQNRDLEPAAHLCQAAPLHRRLEGHRYFWQRHDDLGAHSCRDDPSSRASER